MGVEESAERPLSPKEQRVLLLGSLAKTIRYAGISALDIKEREQLRKLAGQLLVTYDRAPRERGGAYEWRGHDEMDKINQIDAKLVVGASKKLARTTSVLSYGNMASVETERLPQEGRPVRYNAREGMTTVAWHYTRLGTEINLSNEEYPELRGSGRKLLIYTNEGDCYFMEGGSIRNMTPLELIRDQPKTDVLEMYRNDHVGRRYNVGVELDSIVLGEPWRFGFLEQETMPLVTGVQVYMGRLPVDEAGDIEPLAVPDLFAYAARMGGAFDRLIWETGHGGARASYNPGP